jgi:alkanesulfonate monooxygenase SsuD/methylene tetrahydromethanopterin reductase-like flavin-dependent oxidoreductase (luciferase family)
MTKAWTQDRFEHRGRFWTIPEISIYPKPLQQPHPPLFVASVSDETVVATARRGLPILSGQVFMPFEHTLEKIRLYQRALREANTPPAVVERLTRQSYFQRFVYVAETNQKAKKEPREALMKYIEILTKATLPPFAAKLPETYADYRKRAEDRVRLTYEEMLEKTLIFGDPDRCAAKVRELQGMGVDSLLCWMVFGGLEHAKVLRSMELFAKEVMPQFRQTPAAVAG